MNDYDPFIRFQMYALISWSSKNGVALGREELEVRSSTKLTVMNGGKMEPGAIVNMPFRGEIWGGTIQSLHGKLKCHFLCCLLLNLCLLEFCTMLS